MRKTITSNFSRIGSRLVWLILLIFLAACGEVTPLQSLEPTSDVIEINTPTPSSYVPSPSPVLATPAPTTRVASDDLTPTVQSPTLTRTVHQIPTKTSTQTRTITPSPAASLTSTPQPPLEAHTWEVDQILLQEESVGGDACCFYVNPPTLVLYADGLFVKAKMGGFFNFEMLGRKLSRNEICTLLNTFDQIGFLDYDHSVYMDPMDGAPSTHIKINAWGSNFVDGQFLRNWIYEGGDWWIKECPPEKGCFPPPIILPALANAVKLLDNFDPGGLEKLTPENMIIWIIPEDWYSDDDTEPTAWPIDEISLTELSDATNSDNGFSVVINDAAIVHALEKHVSSGYYQEGDLRLMIYIRPLWPAETHFGIWAAGVPTPTPIVPPGTTLSCKPEDGTLPIPDAP